MTIAQLTEEIAKNEALREELFRQIAPINDELTRLYNKNKTLNEQIADVREKEMDETGTIDWEWLLYCTYDDTSRKSKLRSDKLRDLNLGTGGYSPEINQSVIRVSLIKHDEESVPKTLNGLQIVLPFIKPMEDGCKRIAIFESSFSANGIYFLTINGDETEFLIKRTRYSRTEILEKCESLEQALKIVQKKYYSEDKDLEDLI